VHKLVFGVLILDVESNNAESTPVSPVDSILIYELSAKTKTTSKTAAKIRLEVLR